MEGTAVGAGAGGAVGATVGVTVGPAVGSRVGGTAVGGSAVVSYSDVQGGWMEPSVLDIDPLFVSGPLGDYYLSQIAAGQAVDSPCLDAGDPATGAGGWSSLTTRTDQELDTAVVDMGYHYAQICTDEDADGYSTEGGACGDIDCNDGNPNVNPDVVESSAAGNCADGIDNDCDESTDADPECNVGPCAASVEASTLGAGPDYVGSDAGKHVAYFLMPVGALIAIRIWRRKR